MMLPAPLSHSTGAQSAKTVQKAQLVLLTVQAALTVASAHAGLADSDCVFGGTHAVALQLQKAEVRARSRRDMLLPPTAAAAAPQPPAQPPAPLQPLPVPPALPVRSPPLPVAAASRTSALPPAGVRHRTDAAHDVLVRQNGGTRIPPPLSRPGCDNSRIGHERAASAPQPQQTLDPRLKTPCAFPGCARVLCFAALFRVR